jgi:predicted site-specific integrase-resolvase
MPKPEHQPTVADLIPTSQVARIARVDVATVNRWARTGRLQVAVKVPGRTGANLYHRADVEALLTPQDAA